MHLCLARASYDKHKTKVDPYSSQRGLAPLRQVALSSSLLVVGHLGHTYDKFSLYFFPFFVATLVVSSLAFDFIDFIDFI